MVFLKILSAIISVSTYFYCFSLNYENVTKGLNPMETTNFQFRYPIISSLTPLTHPIYLILIYSFCGIFSSEFFQLILGFFLLWMSWFFFTRGNQIQIRTEKDNFKYKLMFLLPCLLGIYLIYSFVFLDRDILYDLILPMSFSFWGIFQFLFGLFCLIFGLFNLYSWIRFLLQGHMKKEEGRVTPSQWLLFTFFLIILGLYHLRFSIINFL